MKYFIQRPEWEQEREVDKETYVDAEREEGFYNTVGYPDRPATSYFIGPNGVRGHLELENIEDFNVPSRRKTNAFDEAIPPGAYNDYP